MTGLSARAALAAALCAFLVLGCATGPPNRAERGSPGLSSPVETASPDWNNPYGEGEVPGGKAPTVKLGEPFKIGGQDERDISVVPEAVEMSAQKVRCGVRYSFRDLVAEYGIDEPPDAAPGKQYCEAKFNAKNISRQPIAWSVSGSLLVTPAGEFTATEGADEVTDALNTRLSDSGVIVGYWVDQPFNPGDVASQMYVWEIPANQKPVAIHLIDEPIEEDPEAIPMDIYVML